ncbi:winged helix-turn-helix domain-containing protein [Shewanella waksmanii]|uniref:winged helix-turn-helix domain-containing protein n=1 Tax=Shewanella waksmanii TaxID=213783 RepID=UPI00048FBFA2|nr:winged helix-turn-helix domain-containing protein [Shewanella waksmanii]
MNSHYQGEGFFIDCQQRQIDFGDRQVEVRPKTLALMLALIESQQQVCSKSQLLEEVWDDVCCDEQVLFQTISEIRRVFGTIKVVQTHPRKGYAWIAPLNKVAIPSAQAVDSDPVKEPKPLVMLEPLPSVMPRDNQVHTAKNHPQRINQLAVYGFAMACVIVAAIYWFQQSRSSEPQVTDGTVIILPVHNQVSGQDHNWVPLGAMEQLIGKLNHRAKVMDISYVLGLSDSLSLSHGFGTQPMRPVFNRSGADVVVETELNGTTRQYHLAYKLHLRQDIKKGVIFSETVDDALNQLAQRIKPYIDDGQSALRLDYQSELSHALVFEALSLYRQQQFADAQKMLASIATLMPDNARIRLLSAQWYVEQHQYDAARKQIDLALSHTGKDDSLHGQLYYWQARALQTSAIEAALNALQLSINASEQVNDLLFSAYAHELQGLMLQQQQHFDAAEQAMRKALRFHQQILCPMGTSSVKLMLAKLHLAQDQLSQARHYRDAAKGHITQQSLPIAIPESLVNI